MTKRRMNLLGAAIAFSIVTIAITAGVIWIQADRLHAVQTMTDEEPGKAADLTELLQDLPPKLDYVRTSEAVNEWYSEPHGPITLDHYGTIASEELEPPDTVAELLAELLKMYVGEAPFTKKRAASIEYYAGREPLASMLGSVNAALPFPLLSEDENEDARIASVQNSYTALRDYIALAAKVS
ncbi:hypothetical protein [Paenibacillus sp. GCM10027626]|uniref:hypothetical protein n=1 Tax=Paenibacillus sp. GCM10027626 TaxID=3273411 RepID=UPI00363A3D40